MTVSRSRQPSTKPRLVGKADRSAGTEIRTVSSPNRMLMTSESESSISGPRRVARVTAAAGLVAALIASGAAPAFSATHADTPAVPAPVKSSADPGRLDTADADLLAKAKAEGEKNVTMMVATTPGAT